MTDPIKQARREALELAIEKCQYFVNLYFKAMDGASDDSLVRYGAACGAARQCAIAIRLEIDKDEKTSVDPQDALHGPPS